jgi:ferredoxin-NADP reductase
VDDAMRRAAGPPDDAAKAAARVFVCGATPFVGTVTRLLVDQGYDPRAIRAEDFGTKKTPRSGAANAVEPRCRAGEDSIQGGAG